MACPHSYVGFEEQVLTGDDDSCLERPPKRLKSEGISMRKRKEQSESLGMPNGHDEANTDKTDHHSQDPNPDAAEPSSAVPDQSSGSEPWRTVLQEAIKSAPRVGNARCAMDSQAWHLAQQILQNTMVMTDMFCLQGVLNDFQVPLHAPSSHHGPLKIHCQHS